MQFRPPKNDNSFIWTKHAVSKMYHYRLSERQCRNLLRNYERQEQGIAPGTLAISRRANTKRPTEIWLMYQEVGKKVNPIKSRKAGISSETKLFNRVKIISVWRYPGISKKGEPVYIPDDIKDYVAR